MRISWLIPLTLFGLSGCISVERPPSTQVVTPAPTVVQPGPGSTVVTHP